MERVGRTRVRAVHKHKAPPPPARSRRLHARVVMVGVYVLSVCAALDSVRAIHISRCGLYLEDTRDEAGIARAS